VVPIQEIGGPQPRKSGGSELRKSGGPQPRKSGGTHQRKSSNSNPLAQAQGLALVYHALGRKRDSDSELAILKSGDASTLAYGYEIAAVYGYRGELDEAFEWLDRTFARKEPSLFIFKGDPCFKRLEADPRYKAFLRKINLPE